MQQLRVLRELIFDSTVIDFKAGCVYKYFSLTSFIMEAP